MKSNRFSALAAAGMLALSLVMLPFPVSAVYVSDVQHLLKSLADQRNMTAANDYNGDGVINAIDLTLMKRDLFSASDETGEVSTQDIPVTEQNNRLIGRTLKQGGVIWLVQSSSALECTVTGLETSVTICGDDGVHADEKYRPRYAAYVDDELVQDVVMDAEEQIVELFKGTKKRTAEVKIMHLSEANNGTIGVRSLTVTTA